MSLVSRCAVACLSCKAKSHYGPSGFAERLIFILLNATYIPSSFYLLNVHSTRTRAPIGIAQPVKQAE